MHATYPSRKVGVIARNVGDETLLYDPGSGAVHVINAMAREVWNKCDGTCGLELIEQHIREVACVPPNVDVRADIRAALTDFARQHLLEAEDA